MQLRTNNPNSAGAVLPATYCRSSTRFGARASCLYCFLMLEGVPMDVRDVRGGPAPECEGDKRQVLTH